MTPNRRMRLAPGTALLQSLLKALLESFLIAFLISRLIIAAR